MWESIVGVLGVAVMGVIGWAFTLNSKVAVLTADNENLKYTIESDKVNLKELMEARFNSMERRLVRIEAKLDHEVG